MIHTLLHKVFAVGMAFLVLLSTLSVTIEKHFCGDNLVNVSLFSEVEKCSMEAEDMALSRITKKSCCKDTVDVVKGQDELIVKTFDDIDIEQQQFIASFALSYVNLFESLPKQVIPHKEYSPPDLVYDIQVVHETFLI